MEMEILSQANIISDGKVVGLRAARAYISDSMEELKTNLNSITDTVERAQLERILTDLQSKKNEILKAVQDDLPDYDDDPENYKSVLFALERVIKEIGDIYFLHKNEKSVEPVKEKSTKQKNNLPTVKPCSPNNLTFLNTRITQFIFDPIRCAELVEPFNIGLRKPTPNTKNLKYVKDVQCFQVIDGMDLPASINAFDKIVLSSICTLCDELIVNGKQDEMIVTPQMIYQCYAGKTASKKAQIENIAKSVRKMMTTILSFDWREHAVAKRLLSKEDSEILSKSENFIVVRQNMLYAQEIIAQINGAKVQAFRLLKIPALYAYSRDVGQIVTIPKNLLQIPGLKNTDEITLMKIYLAKRIELMRNKKNSVKSNSILFETIAKECQTEEWNLLNKTEKMRKRQVVSRILDNWKEEKYIKSYLIAKKGGIQTGVEIVLN